MSNNNQTYNKPGRLSQGLGNFTASFSTAKGPETHADIQERITRDRDMSKITVKKPRQDVDPFDTNVRKRVAIYCRVSSDKLSQTPSFYTQQQYYLKYVRSRSDLHMVVMYKDEGISATGIVKRTGLVNLLRDAEAGRFDMVIVKNLSRLSRNLMDCMRIIYKLRQLPNPVGILFEEERLYTLDKKNDLTLSILALIAQEESHKKSDAVTRAQRMRYEMGNFMVFDVFGFQRIGVNEIDINIEEAKSLQLIFMMYMAGCSPKFIAEVLNMLQRKTHTHHYVDGRVKEGVVDWTADRVINILKNEKCCGNVDAQKTVTPSYLDHKAVKNVDKAPKYYAVEQHTAIINPEDYYITQKIMNANRGGWKDGVQDLGIYEEGILAGGVLSVPNWNGFGAEDYNRACLRAYGMPETDLEDIEKRIKEQEDEWGKVAEDFGEQDIPETVEVDSDDYENFPEEDVEESNEEVDEREIESFDNWVIKLRETEKERRDRIQSDNNSCIECSCAELFSLNEKVCITLDHRGATFNKFSFNRLNEDVDDVIMQVELVYNPLEQMLIVREAKESTPKTIEWVKEDNDGKYTMKRCCTKGLSAAIYQNMRWNTNFKYRIVGRAYDYEGETMLVFFLDRTIKNVPVSQYGEEDVKEGKKDKKKAKRMFMDGYLPDDIILPDLEEFNLGDGPLATQAKNLSKSSAIYYDDATSKDEGALTIKDLGDEKYSPDRIRYMLQRGLSPQEGWSYLKGMARISNNRFTILSEDLADSFGDRANANRDARLKDYVSRKKKGSMKTTPYGWTVGLDLPSMDTVNATIEELKSEMLAG